MTAQPNNRPATSEQPHLSGSVGAQNIVAEHAAVDLIERSRSDSAKRCHH